MSSTYWELLFREVSADKLFELEDEAGEPDAASDYMEALVAVLAKWREQLQARNWDCEPERRVYRKCVDKVSEAWLLYSFTNQGSAGHMPDTFALDPRKRGAK
ncbi:hypothetical protein ABZV60_19370 [Streptomyces sp. NPDC004787]|uniref:hypothetical protein n=1 Tax=Streptomyces sp. NPDC004787 TaxID=3154291 RepID=UPI0033B84789